MPFLFVDYDQGAGGEYFCHQVSQAPECVTLQAKKFATGRTKINDIFNQEFLKLDPQQYHNVQSNDTLYDLVPAHRTTGIAKAHFDNVFSIRICWPVDLIAYKFLRYQKIQKVLLAVEPNDSYFTGYLKILTKEHENKSFLRHVDRSMDNLSLKLLALGQEPTSENRQRYIESMYVYSARPEPDVDYDLVIPYETLLSDPQWIVDNLKEKFGITLPTTPFEKYCNEYQQFQKMA